MRQRIEPRGVRSLLEGLAQEAFEAWVGDRFRDLGYDVRVTPFQGDHGADLLVTRAGETVVVQCKHRPAGAIGEPVLRDLFGAMHHFGAARAILVTTGRLTPAARDWLQGKPMDAWGARDLQDRWPAEIALTTEHLAATAPPVNPAGASQHEGTRSGWYVYAHGETVRYAVKLPRSVGDHPALGFEPLADPDMPILPGGIPMRYAKLVDARDRRRSRTVPVGTWKALQELIHEVHSIDFVQRNGTMATWHYYGTTYETGRAAKKRARRMGGAPDLLPPDVREQIARQSAEERNRRARAQAEAPSQ
ncbi:MAG: restriction endonuclease [Chloroflexota bacterium]